ncbi:MAG TPA: ABC transporter ATP-binding protein [Microbacterium sp.]|nr:ABC transporter ATP-binding protein [Microbacterium sp.]
MKKKIADELVDRGGPAIALSDVRKVYNSGARTVQALRGVTLDVARGSFTAVMGPSGSGKSTLLHCAAGLDTPSSGSVRLAGRDLDGLSDDALTEFRREHAAFIFQSFNLMPALTVRRNVALPMILAGRRVDDVAVDRAIERVGLADRADHRPGELSGGQQQRVAIARALAGRADVLFADEPTGALDTATAASVLTLMRESVTQHGQAILMTTHDPVAASYADQVVIVIDGQIAVTLYGPTPESVSAELTRVASRMAVR